MEKIENYRKTVNLNLLTKKSGRKFILLSYRHYFTGINRIFFILKNLSNNNIYFSNIEQYTGSEYITFSGINTIFIDNNLKKNTYKLSIKKDTLPKITILDPSFNLFKIPNIEIKFKKTDVLLSNIPSYLNPMKDFFDLGFFYYYNLIKSQEIIEDNKDVIINLNKIIEDKNTEIDELKKTIKDLEKTKDEKIVTEESIIDEKIVTDESIVDEKIVTNESIKIQDNNTTYDESLGYEETKSFSLDEENEENTYPGENFNIYFQEMKKKFPSISDISIIKLWNKLTDSEKKIYNTTKEITEENKPIEMPIVVEKKEFKLYNAYMVFTKKMKEEKENINPLILTEKWLKLSEDEKEKYREEAILLNLQNI